MKLGDISASFVRLMADTVNDQGCDMASLFAEFGIDEDFLNTPDARISIPRYMRLGHAAIKLTNNPALGLKMGSLSHVSLMELVGFMAMSSPNLLSAHQILTHYELLISQNCRGQSDFTVQDGKGISRFYSIAPYNDYNLFVVDSVLSSWYQMTRWLSGRPDCVESVHFEFSPPDYAKAYEAFFQCKIYFEQPFNGLTIKAEALALPLKYSDPVAFKILQKQCQLRLESIQLQQTLAEQVQEKLGPQLNGKAPSLETIANLMGTTPWTLRRQLAKENLTYQQLLDDTRKDLATSYVRDTNLALGEISYLLGFANPTAFQRAYKRWTGLAPGISRKAFR